MKFHLSGGHVDINRDTLVHHDCDHNDHAMLSLRDPASGAALSITSNDFEAWERIAEAATHNAARIKAAEAARVAELAPHRPVDPNFRAEGWPIPAGGAA